MNILKNINIRPFAILLLSLAFLTLGCKKDKDSPTERNSKVYVAGISNAGPNETWAASIWENGKVKQLTDGSKNVYAQAIYVANNSVYAAGRQDLGTVNSFQGKMWKDGVESLLDNSGHLSEAYDMLVSGTDVYIAGRKRINDMMIACIWKNGVPQVLSDGKTDAFIYSIFVHGKDVYATGAARATKDKNSSLNPKVWKNGVAQTLEATKSAVGNAIFVANNDVYVAGAEDGEQNLNSPRIWKNGKQTNFTDGLKRGRLDGLAVHNNDVYAVGSVYINQRPSAVLLKNNTLTELTDGSMEAAAKDIAIFDDDVYIVGFQTFGQNNVKGKLWINGEASDLNGPQANSQSNAYAVFVTHD